MPKKLELTPQALHGIFDRSLPPITVVQSGDEIELETLDAAWSREPFPDEYAPRKSIVPLPHPSGHALTGPIAVANTLPGDTLEIRIEELTPRPHGYTEAGGIAWPHYERLRCAGGPPRMLLWQIDPAAGVATTTSTGPKRSVALAPFLGVMGLAPGAPGPHSTTPPRRVGGNLDCALLTAGSTLYLPVEVPGALLSVGDGHAAQGDGELSNNGIECAMERVRLRLIRRTDFEINSPVIRTPTAWAVLGLGATLDDAMYQAANGMLDLMSRLLPCKRVEALGLMSVAVDFRITQVVNGIKGVHAVWRDDAIRE